MHLHAPVHLHAHVHKVYPFYEGLNSLGAVLHVDGTHEVKLHLLVARRVDVPHALRVDGVMLWVVGTLQTAAAQAVGQMNNAYNKRLLYMYSLYCSK